MCWTVVVGSASFWAGRSCSLSGESSLVLGEGVVVDWGICRAPVSVAVLQI